MARRQHPRPATPAPVGRRAALLGGVGGVAWLVTGCVAGDSGSSSTGASSPTAVGSSPDAPSGSPSATPTAPAPTEAGPSPLETGDRTRVRLALEQTEAMLAGLLALRRPGSATGLVELHTAHRTALMSVLEEPDRPLPDAPEPRLTRPEIPLREAGLQAELVSAALTAEDGLVARLLASMSAGVAQQLALLPASTSRGPTDSSSPTSPSEATA